MTEPSEAAKARAYDLICADFSNGPAYEERAFARFIQQVSDAAKDVAATYPGTLAAGKLAPFILPHPLVQEAVNLVLAESITRTDNQLAAIRSGHAGQDKVSLALAALRRGIEIAKGSPQ